MLKILEHSKELKQGRFVDTLSAVGVHISGWCLKYTIADCNLFTRKFIFDPR